MTSPKILSLNCVVQRSPDVIAAEADEDLVMVSIENGFYYGVSNVARSIWETIENPRRISDIVADLSTSYEVDRTTCEKQTLSFLESLRTENLLQVVNEPNC